MRYPLTPLQRRISRAPVAPGVIRRTRARAGRLEYNEHTRRANMLPADFARHWRAPGELLAIAHYSGVSVLELIEKIGPDVPPLETRKTI